MPRRSPGLVIAARGRAPNGAELRVAACIVATVRDGRIARVEEYLDSAQIAALSR